MNRLRTLAFLALTLPAVGADSAPKPIYTNDFETSEIGKTPADFLVTSGTFTVKQNGANHVLELPGEPLDTFGLLFGPTQRDGVSASAKFFGTKTGRKFPTFGVSLNGAGGYRLQISPGKRAIEIFKGDESRVNVPFEWASGTWTHLRIQVRPGSRGAYIIEGKAWSADAPEPTAWMISLEEKEAPSSGRAGLWGSPYSGTPILFDDLLLTPLH